MGVKVKNNSLIIKEQNMQKMKFNWMPINIMTLTMGTLVCFPKTVISVDHPVWVLVCYHYGLQNVFVEPGAHPAIRHQATQRLYQELEYIICKIRRLIFNPVARQRPTAKNGDVRGDPTWTEWCRKKIATWRLALITCKRF